VNKKGKIRYVVKHETVKMSSNNVIDNSNKLYLDLVLNGWKIKYEPGVFEICETCNLKGILEEDLNAIETKLPIIAYKKLQNAVTLWLNDTIRYGPAPGIKGVGCVFHESAEWLKDNGLTTEKEGCIEMYSALDYLKSRRRWGIGGLLLHELCHAYHFHCINDGFQNSLLQKTYDTAMQAKLYDKVSFKIVPDQDTKELNSYYDHAVKKSETNYRHYACTNVMEFFAELSCAFHCDNTEDYNSWFPYNRIQLANHDPNSLQVLQTFWDSSE